MILFHVSYDITQPMKHSFYPRIPSTIQVNEDNNTPRICFSDSIINCIRSINGYPKIDEDSLLIIVYEFEPNPNDGKLIPWQTLYSQNLVPDAALTHEYWYCSPISLKGKLHRMSNIVTKPYIQVANNSHATICNIISSFGIRTEVLNATNPCDILNIWLPKNVGNHTEILSIIKQNLCHEEPVKDCPDTDLFQSIFHETPRTTKTVYDYHEIQLLDACKITPV